MPRSKRLAEIPPEHPEEFKDAPCARCDAVHYSVLGFNFPGEWRLEQLVCLLASHPEYAEWLDDDIHVN